MKKQRLSDNGIHPKINRPITVVLMWSVVTTGCGSEQTEIPERRPRPVIVDALRKQSPPNASMVSASVGSWKTEQIGFEVSGRIDYVVEPNTEIEGRISDKEGNVITKGTPVGQIESERYSLQVAMAKAEVTRAEQNLLAAKTLRTHNPRQRRFRQPLDAGRPR